MGWNYPPGVTGNEPQITGEWPCVECDGEGGERDPDGGNHHYTCPHCRGTGIEPEEYDLKHIEEVADNPGNWNRATREALLDYVTSKKWDVHKTDDRRHLVAAIAIRKEL